MKRLLPTAIGGFVVLMLMFRGFSLEADAAANATNSSAPLETVNQVLEGLGVATGTGLPMGMLAAGLAILLAIGYGVVN